jgi:hypothetical protein
MGMGYNELSPRAKEIAAFFETRPRVERQDTNYIIQRDKGNREMSAPGAVYTTYLYPAFEKLAKLEASEDRTLKDAEIIPAINSAVRRIIDEMKTADKQAGRN